MLLASTTTTATGEQNSLSYPNTLDRVSKAKIEGTEEDCAQETSKHALNRTPELLLYIVIVSHPAHRNKPAGNVFDR